jgi:vacuolar-type H+-ATPase subunit E/Vma4
MPAPAGALFEQLRHEAATKAAQRLEQARADAQRALADAQAGVVHRRDAAKAERARAAALALESVRAEVGQRVRRETLEARAAALDRVFAAAALAVNRLGGNPNLPAAIARSVTRALAFLPDGPVAVRCNGEIAKMASLALAGLGRADDVVRIEDGFPLGVRVESLDGSIAVDETFGRLLARARPRLAIALVRQIEERAP